MSFLGEHLMAYTASSYVVPILDPEFLNELSPEHVPLRGFGSRSRDVVVGERNHLRRVPDFVNPDFFEYLIYLCSRVTGHKQVYLGCNVLPRPDLAQPRLAGQFFFRHSHSHVSTSLS